MEDRHNTYHLQVPNNQMTVAHASGVPHIHRHLFFSTER